MMAAVDLGLDDVLAPRYVKLPAGVRAEEAAADDAMALQVQLRALAGLGKVASRAASIPGGEAAVDFAAIAFSAANASGLADPGALAVGIGAMRAVSCTESPATARTLLEYHVVDWCLHASDACENDEQLADNAITTISNLLRFEGVLSSSELPVPRVVEALQAASAHHPSHNSLSDSVCRVLRTLAGVGTEGACRWRARTCLFVSGACFAYRAAQRLVDVRAFGPVISRGESPISADPTLTMAREVYPVSAPLAGHWANRSSDIPPPPAWGRGATLHRSARFPLPSSPRSPLPCPSWQMLRCRWWSTVRWPRARRA